MSGDSFLEFIRDVSGEGYDDIEMIRLVNKVIYDINSRSIGGLKFLPLHDDICGADKKYMVEHSIGCLLKQAESECMSIIPDGVVAQIKLIEEDYNSYSAYTDKYEMTIQRYASTWVMFDMTGRGCAEYAYDRLEDFTCTCHSVHDYDHVHDTKKISVVNSREYIKAVAKGEYKNHNTVNNSPTAIEHRKKGRY